MSDEPIEEWGMILDPPIELREEEIGPFIHGLTEIAEGKEPLFKQEEILMGTPAGGLSGQAKSTFSLHVLAAIAALVSLGGGAFYASGLSRGFILAGLACAAVAYFSKS